MDVLKKYIGNIKGTRLYIKILFLGNKGYQNIVG